MSKQAAWKAFGAFFALAFVAFMWVAIATAANWHPMVLAVGCALITLSGSLIAIIAIDGAKRCCQRQIKQLKIDQRAELRQSRIDLVQLLPALQCIADGYPWSRGDNARFLTARWLMQQFDNGGNTIEWVEALRDGDAIPLAKLLDHMGPDERDAAEVYLRMNVMGAIDCMVHKHKPRTSVLYPNGKDEGLAEEDVTNAAPAE